MSHMNPTTFLIIRHGQTEWNRVGRLMGISDIPLTPLGKKQAQMTAQYLKNYPIDAIVTSPLKRAAETAEILSASHKNADFVTLQELRERSFGKLEGLFYEEVNSRYPQLTIGTWWQYPNFRPPDGESLEEVLVRADRAIHILLRTYAGKTVAVVSHGTFIRNFIAKLLDIPRAEINTYGFDNASISVVRVTSLGGEAHILNMLPETRA